MCVCGRAQLRDLSSNEKPLFVVMRTRVFNKDSIVICFELISGHLKELVRGQTDVQGLFVVCVCDRERDTHTHTLFGQWGHVQHTCSLQTLDIYHHSVKTPPKCDRHPNYTH